MLLPAFLRRWLGRRGDPRVAIGTVSQGEMPIRALLRVAILQKEQVFAFHRGRLIGFCPHALASGPNGLYVLAFVIAGGRDVGNHPLASPKRWRWLSLADLRTAMRRPGEWFSAPRESRPVLRSLSIELEAA